MLEIMILILFGALCLFGVSIGIIFLSLSNFVMNKILNKSLELQKKIIDDDWL